MLYSNAYILAKGTISVTSAADAPANNNNYKVIFKIVLHALIL